MHTDSGRAALLERLLPGFPESGSWPSSRHGQAARPGARHSPAPPLPSLPPLSGPTYAEARLLPRRLGRYTLFDDIGRGGMADIFLAQARHDFGASRLVVIKEVLPALAGSREFSEMLASEAKLAAGLCHANVVQVEHLGREGSSLYIAMEYVEGLDLREVLRRCARQKVALPIEFSLRIVVEVLKGLSYAHRARDARGARLGIVHRDVSPSNVLLSFEGEVKLCDFGIARATPLAATLTDEVIVGKAGYMSPEQARGEALDARADVFSAGVILWELLAGRRLYKAARGETLIAAARRAEIPPLPARGLREEEVLHAIVERSLAASRDARYESAAEMLQDLEEYAISVGMAASPIRFGAFLQDNFAEEVLSSRRARALLLRALPPDPAADIDAAMGHARGRTEPESEATPSAFPVAAPEESRPSLPPSSAEFGTQIPRRDAHLAPIAPLAPRAWDPTAARAALEAKAFAWALGLATTVFLALWCFARP